MMREAERPKNLTKKRNKQFKTINMSQEEKIKWCIERHRLTNHYYDDYLPYEFHLRMVAQVAQDFIKLPENNWSEYIIAAYGHDLIEDTRTSYNDCKNVLGEFVANIIYAVTNEKGRNRKQRANGWYYDGIINTEGAIFIKLCDRIANVQYSKLTKSRMFDMYKDENKEFKGRLFNPFFVPMFDYLDELLNSKKGVQVSDTTEAK